jgi:uncharacterized protein YbjT (DUF2867 family)
LRLPSVLAAKDAAKAIAAEGVEVLKGDISDPETVKPALKDAEVRHVSSTGYHAS